LSSRKFDVVVVGAGTAGAYAAYVLASNDLRVALMDRKSESEIGLKVCGDAIGKHHFDNLNLSYPSGPELEGIFKGVKIVSPNEEHSIIVKGDGFAINRHAFGQRLLKIALNAGAEFYGRMHAVNPIVRGNYVVGVRAANLNTGLEEVFKAKVTIDATGFASVIRSKLTGWWISERVKPEEVNVCYREILETKEKFDTTYAVIYLSKKIAPGGYWWLFPKKSRLVNVGLGVQPVEGAPSPVNQYRKYIAVRDELRDSKVIDGGGGVVPTRRPIHCPVGNGILAIGDAACTCNPIHGGGIGPSMISAKHAAEIIVEILSGNQEPSIRNLWEYTIRYLRDYGIKQTSLDIFRMFLQRLSDEDLNFVFEKQVITGEEVNAVGRTGELRVSVVRRLGKALRLISRPTILFRLKTVKEYMGKIAELYEKYPSSPEKFISWKSLVEKLINEYVSKL